MNAPRVAVIGGGLAGLAAAVACADAGARVTLFEARPRLGGATWSTELHGLRVDNGQHVFLRCCTEYLGFLGRIGALDRIELQARLEIPVMSPGARTSWLRRARLPAPLHLAPSLARFAPLPIGERLRLVPAARRLAALRLDDPALDATSFGAWLRANGQSNCAIERFWDLIARPTLNLPAAEASLALAAKVFQTGLLQAPDAADIGWAVTPLERAHAEPATHALAKRRAQVLLRARVQQIELDAAGAASGVRVAGRRWDADAVVLAAPHEDAVKLLPDSAGVDPSDLASLGSSPIVNLHTVWDRAILPHRFAAGVGTKLEWLFDRSAAAGLSRGQYLAVSLSSADDYVGVSSERLRQLFEPEFRRLLPAARNARLERFFATCEPAATFRQAPGTQRLRPGARTGVAGLYLAGAWTDTGWPATMEGAVRSGVTAARAALVGAGRSLGLPEVAA